MIAERELSTTEARHRLDTLCQLLNLKCTVSHQDGHALVATCTLYSLSGEETSAGAGKGQHCMLGAVAESLEHHFLGNCTTDGAQMMSGDLIQSLARGHDDWLLNSVPTSSQLSAYRMEALEGDSSLYVPSILLNPSSRYIKEANETEAAFLSKYSSNSGMALGCTENEALLHAINECIERHALSVYFLSTCQLMPALTVMKPSLALLTETFSENANLLAHSRRLSIYMLNDFYGLFFCIAMAAPEHESTLAIIGSGCSASASVALYRAVTEQLQCAHLRGDQEKDEDHDTYRMLSTSTRLSKLLNPVTRAKLAELKPAACVTSLRKQIQHTTANLKAHGRSVFYRTLFHEPGLACAVQVYIPGLERFHLIRSGLPVVPQSALSQGARSPHVYL